MSDPSHEICKLCQRERELRFSHVIPEFMYLETYDKKHRALKIEDDPEAGETYLQKGEREHLFCDNCEGHLSRFETYSSPIVKSLMSLEAEEQGTEYVVRNVDYRLFKLFQMSLIWRASIASIDVFQKVKLNVHALRLREMLLSEDPGAPEDFGCMMFALQDTKYLHRMIWSPVTDEIDGAPVYRFQTGRLFWYFFLPGRFPDDAAKYFLNEDGLLRVLKAPWPEQVVVQRLAGRIAEARRRAILNGD